MVVVSGHVYIVCFFVPTMVVVSCKIFPVDEQVVVLVELPELAVDDIEVLVAEEVGHLER